MTCFFDKKFIVSIFLLIFLGACGSPFGTTDEEKNISSADYCPFSKKLADGTCPTDEKLPVDTTPPLAPIVSSSLALTAVKKPIWTWTSGGGGLGTYRYKLDDSDLSTGATETTATSFAPTSDLSVGTHTLNVQEKDDAGNWSDSGNYLLQVASDAYFIKAIGGTDTDKFESVIELSTGGFVAVGTTKSDGAGGEDGFIVKFDENGDKVWAKTVGQSNIDRFTSVAELQDGGIVAVGYAYGTGFVSYDGIFVKFNQTDGSVLWKKSIGEDDSDQIYSVIALSTGGLLAAGLTRSDGAGNYDGFLVNLNADGTVEWVKFIGSSYEEKFFSLIELADGNFVAVGQWGTVSHPYGLIVKFDSTFGNILKSYYVKTSSSSRHIKLNSVVELSSGALVAAGNLDHPEDQGLLFKFAPDTLDKEWAFVYRSSGSWDDIYFESIIKLSAGDDLVVTGLVKDYSGGFTEGYLVKFDGISGALTWSKTIGVTSSVSSFNSVIESAAGNLVASGYTNGDGAGDYDGFLVELNQDGGPTDLSWLADETDFSGDEDPSYPHYIGLPWGGITINTPDPMWSTVDADGLVVSDVDQADTETEIDLQIVP